MAETTLDAYIECALWASTDENGEPLDDLYGSDDLAPETIAQMCEDVSDFLALCLREGIDLTPLSASQIGHDFWLTRNRHGVGFWDRGLGALGDRLTEIAHSYGSVDLYVGDDGKVHDA